MKGVRRACAIGAGIWLTTHGPLPALPTLEQHRHPALAVLALVVVLAGSVVAVRPLRGGPTALGAPAAVVLAALPPLAGLAVMPFLPVEAWRTHANWWPGLSQVLVAALVVRRRWAPALASELASAAVLTGCVLAAGGPHRAMDVAALNQPALVWFTASLGVRFVFDRTAREVERYEADAARAAAAQAASAARASSARLRRDELERDTVPLLRRVAAAAVDDATWPQLSLQARRAERQLRDDLRARALLDDGVRRELHAARERGCHVDVIDDRGSVAAGPGDEGFLPAVRTLLRPALAACGTARFTARLSPGGRLATVSVDGSPAAVRAVAAAVRSAALRELPLEVDVDLHSGSLWAELRPASGGGG
ncbi:hypothetical protein [Kineococcus sp. SYSU DK006]|uniref:hypothetical protein n=1 Tax=Kineococcus sp. SYSU DK006 TaxID=3383127 RepID=UPI003D7EFC40